MNTFPLGSVGKYIWYDIKLSVKSFFELVFKFTLYRCCHIIVCPQFTQSRQEIVNYIYKNDFDLDEKSILGEKFDHKLLFEYLKRIDFYKKI